MRSLRSIFNSKLIIDLVALVLLFFVGLVIFREIFQYGLCCDDLRNLFFVKSFEALGGSTNLFFEQHGGNNFFMLIMSTLFGLRSYYYFFIAFALRIVAAYSLYLLGKLLFNNRLVGFIAALLFTVSFSGIQATEQTTNANSYIGLIFLNIGLIFLYKYFMEYKRIGKLLLAYIFFVSAIMIATLRFSGLPIFYISIELLLFISKYSSFKQVLARLFLFFLFLLPVIKLGYFSSGSFLKDSLFTGSGIFAGSLSDVVHSPLLFFSEFFDVVTPPVVDVHLGAQISVNAIFFIGITILVSQVWLANYFKKYRAPFLGLAVVSEIFLISLGYLIRVGYTDIPFILFGGISFVIIYDILIVNLFIDKKTSFILLCLTSWPFCFLLINHLFNRQRDIDYSRFYTVPVAGIYLLLSALLISVIPAITRRYAKALPKYFSKIYTLFVVAILAFLVITNSSSVMSFLKESKPFRSEAVYTAAFKTINDEVYLQRRTRPVIYLIFDSDSLVDSRIAGYGINWADTGDRFCLQNNNYDLRYCAPLFVNSFNELARIYSGYPESLYGLKPPGIQDIYAFEIKNGKVSSETQLVRGRLTSREN